MNITERETAVKIAELLTAEAKWARAHIENDIDTLDRLMAEEYSQIADDGRLVRKQDVLASFGRGERHWDEAFSDRHEVKVYDEVAVVIGRWRGKGVNAGHPFDYWARYVSVWVRRDGRWQMVSDQSTTIA